MKIISKLSSLWVDWQNTFEYMRSNKALLWKWVKWTLVMGALSPILHVFVLIIIGEAQSFLNVLSDIYAELFIWAITLIIDSRRNFWEIKINNNTLFKNKIEKMFTFSSIMLFLASVAYTVAMIDVLKETENVIHRHNEIYACAFVICLISIYLDFVSVVKRGEYKC